jgi:hypothetical protein
MYLRQATGAGVTTVCSVLNIFTGQYSYDAKFENPMIDRGIAIEYKAGRWICRKGRARA